MAEALGFQEANTRREREVWQACDDLWAIHGDFSQLTGDQIREKLLNLGYKKGSPNEVYKYRKTWESSRKIKKADSQGQIATPEDPISRAVNLVHEQIKAKSAHELDSLRQKYDATSQSLQKKIDDLQILCKAQAEKLQDNQSTHSQQAKEIATLTRLTNEKEEELLIIRTKYEQNLLHLKESRDSIAGFNKVHQSEIKTLSANYEGQIKDLKECLKTSKEEIRQLGSSAMDESNYLKAELKSLKLKEDKIRKQLEMTTKNEAGIRAELKATKADFKLWIKDNIVQEKNFDKWAARQNETVDSLKQAFKAELKKVVSQKRAQPRRAKK